MISELERDSANVSEAEKQMLDCILDGGRLLSPHVGTERTEADPSLSFTATSVTQDKSSSIHIVLSHTQYETLGSRLNSLHQQTRAGRILPDIVSSG